MKEPEFNFDLEQMKKAVESETVISFDHPMAAEEIGRRLMRVPVEALSSDEAFDLWLASDEPEESHNPQTPTQEKPQ